MRLRRHLLIDRLASRMGGKANPHRRLSALKNTFYYSILSRGRHSPASGARPGESQRKLPLKGKASSVVVLKTSVAPALFLGE